MKNILWILSLSLAAASLFSSCNNEEDDIFADSSAVRLEQAKKEYTERLADTENGWAMEYYPTTNKGVRGYMLLANFYRDGSVKVAMKNELSNNQYVDSVSIWKIIADNGPVLTFDSYNPYFHLFSTPEDIKETEDKDEQGLGREGDYEFIIVDAPENAQDIMLKGKKRGTYIHLTRIPAGIDWKDYYKEIETMNSLLFGNTPNSLYLRCGENLYTVYDGNTAIFNIVKPGGDPIADEDYYPFLVNTEGVRLYKEFVCPTGEKVQEFKLSEDKSKFISLENENIWMEGPNPLNIFDEQILGLYKYALIDGEMSSDLQAIYDRIKADCAAKKVPLKQIYLTYSSKYEMHRVVIQVSSTNAFYLFDKENIDGKVVYTFSKNDPDSKNAQVFYERYDGVADLINMLSGTYLLGQDKCGLNYSTMKFTKEDNSLWFNLKLID